MKLLIHEQFTIERRKIGCMGTLCFRSTSNHFGALNVIAQPLLGNTQSNKSSVFFVLHKVPFPFLTLYLLSRVQNHSSSSKEMENNEKGGPITLTICSEDWHFFFFFNLNKI